jgi:hypothetical protein
MKKGSTREKGRIMKMKSEGHNKEKLEFTSVGGRSN